MNYLQRKKYALKKATNFKGYLNSTSGLNPLTVPNSMNENILNLTVTGNSYHDYEEGDNCFDFFDAFNNPNGTLWDYYLVKYIKLKPNTQYTMSSNTPRCTTNSGSKIGLLHLFSGKNPSTYYYSYTVFGVVAENEPQTWCTDDEGYLTVLMVRNKTYSSEEEAPYLSIDNVAKTLEDVENGKYWIMLNEGTEPLEWKPHKSLGSDCIKEIKNCGDKTVNLFDINQVMENYQLIDTGNLWKNTAWNATDFIEASQGDYTISEKYTGYAQYTIGFYDIDKTLLEFNKSYNYAGKATFTAPEGTSYLRFSYSKRVSGVEVNRCEIQLQKGSEATNYEPYNLYKIPLEQKGNLFNPRDTIKGTNPEGFYKLGDDDFIDYYCDNSSNNGVRYPSYSTNPSDKIKSNKLYTLYTEVEFMENTQSASMISFATTDISQFKTINSIKNIGTTRFYAVPYEDMSNSTIKSMLRTLLSTKANSIGRGRFRISLFEGENPTAAEDFVYSPYRDNFNSVNIYTPEPIMGGISGSSDADRFGDDIVIDIKNRRATLIKKFKKVVIDTEVVNVKYGSSDGGISSYNYFWNTNEYSTLRNVCNFRFTKQIIHDSQYCVDYGAIICSHFIRNRGTWTSKKEGVNIISKNDGVDLTIDYDAIGYPVYSTIEELPASATDGDLNRVYDETTEYKWYQYSEADSSWSLCIDEQGDERYPVGGVGDKDFRIAMQKAFANWLIAQDEAGTPLTIWYESTDTSNYEEIDISEYQDWDALERFILSRGTNSITADTSISPLNINIEYYGDKYIEE